MIWLCLASYSLCITHTVMGNEIRIVYLLHTLIKTHQFLDISIILAFPLIVKSIPLYFADSMRWNKNAGGTKSCLKLFAFMKFMFKMRIYLKKGAWLSISFNRHQCCHLVIVLFCYANAFPPLFWCCITWCALQQSYEVNSRGIEIFWKSWLPGSARPKASVFFCHGYGDTCTFFIEGVYLV